MRKPPARSTLLLAFALVAPIATALAQSSTPPSKPIVTGGDPQPTGSSVPSLGDLLLLLPSLASL